MTNKFVIVNLKDGDEAAYLNEFQHNLSDFGNQMYIGVENVFYLSKAHKDVLQGEIAIAKIQRTKHGLKIGDAISLKSKQQVNPLVPKQLKLKLSIFGRVPEEMITVHHDQFIKYLITMKHYFIPGQYLLIKYLNYNFVISVIKGVGNLNNDTEILLSSDDYNITIIGDNLMSQEFFQPNFSFESIGIGGMDNELASVLRRALSTRAIRPDIMEKMGIQHVKGIILHGPPGTGKTRIARNMGSLLSKIPPIVVNGPEILNKYVGQSEENMRNLFEPAINDYKTNGQNSKLHIIIFDEMDAICKKRGSTSNGVGDSLINQLLTLIDGINALPNIFIIGMTNRLDMIDEALMRPGRLEFKVKIGLPDANGRLQIFRIHTDKMRNNNLVEPIDFSSLVEQTKNYSGAEIEAVVKSATSYAFTNHLQNENSDIIVKAEYFQRAINEIVPAFGNKEIKEIGPCLLYENQQDVLDSLVLNNDFSTTLIYGKLGKTTLLCKLASQIGSECYVKIIRPIDMVKMDEHEKVKYVTEILDRAYESPKSVMMIDDIDILLNYVTVGTSTIFSNRLYQILRTILKTKPVNKFYFICTTSNEELDLMIKSDFKYWKDL